MSGALRTTSVAGANPPDEARCRAETEITLEMNMLDVNETEMRLIDLDDFLKIVGTSRSSWLRNAAKYPPAIRPDRAANVKFLNLDVIAWMVSAGEYKTYLALGAAHNAGTAKPPRLPGVLAQ